jgi:hypothetical protein
MKLKEAWQKFRQTSARIKADKRNRALDEWRRSYPKEYASWLAAGCPAIFICRQLDE